MNVKLNISHNTDRANSYHSSECVDPINCPKCKAYVESVRVTPGTVLAALARIRGGRHE
ncbi:hypothetical protein [Acinetobacter radioresistens]|uniref:hypothetical protein n=1 Tax=Acinetobacter radioresistens TaxID=40216 RepID=UPI00157AE623|nr:hypothetical protein [Acinetobacter radioresistens]